MTDDDAEDFEAALRETAAPWAPSAATIRRMHPVDVAALAPEYLSGISARKVKPGDRDFARWWRARCEMRVMR